MAEFVVNVTLIAALLVLLVVWAVSAVRRRRQARREHAQQRRLILSALTAAAHGTPAVLGGDDDDEDDGLDDPTRPSRPDRTARRAAAARPAPARQLDAASIAALHDLLEDRRPARRGAITALLTSPRSVWSAGARAGQSIARHTTGERDQAPVQSYCAELYREAAGELAGIHAHAAADATCAEHGEVAQVVEEITRAVHGPESVR